MLTHSQHIFGRTIEYGLTILAGDQEIEPDSIVSARLYPSIPTAAQRADDDGSEGGFVGAMKTSWVSEGSGEYRIDFDAVTDPNPDADQEFANYYPVVNFRFQPGGPIESLTEAIIVWRPNGLTSRIRVTPQDVFNLEDKIKALRDEVWVQPKIDAAVRWFFRELKKKGFEKRRVFNLEEAKDAVLNRACAYCCRDLDGQDSQRWGDKMGIYFEESKDALNNVMIGYDVDGDGVLDPDETAQVSNWQSIQQFR